MAAPYIPATDSGLDTWATNFATLLTADPAAYGEDAASALVVQTARDTYAAAYTAANDPSTRTPAAVAAKDAARVSLEEAARPVAQRINANVSVTNQQRTDLGITVRKTTRTPVPPPATAPSLLLRGQIPGVATVQIRDTSTPTSKAKPLGVIGCDLHVTIDAVAATDPEAAPLAKTTGKTPNTLEFDPADAGKIATVWGRWTTRSGPAGTAQKGPWSTAMTIVIM